MTMVTGDDGNASALPVVDWNDLGLRREKFLEDLRVALGEVGFCVLTNHPDFTDDFQQKMFKSARQFFDASDEEKALSDISKTPYFRGWSKDRQKEKGKIPVLLAQEAYQYGFDCEPVAAPDDTSVPVYKRLFRGPNTYPDEETFPDFRPAIDSMNTRYFNLTHSLGHLICESIGADEAIFEELFPYDDPDLAASLNFNKGMDAVPEKYHDLVREEYDKPFSMITNAHIDGPPFIALLMNDRPGLQVVAGKGGGWIDAPVTCRTSPGKYDVPVIPGSLIVNSGGLLFHLSRGKVVATLHRVNVSCIPRGETRVSLPYFLIPKMEGPLVPFFEEGEDTGFNYDRERGTNAAVNRMNLFPQCTRMWWSKEFEMLRDAWMAEVARETSKTYELAQKRAAKL